MVDGVCVLCQKSRVLVKSHIVPLSFYKKGNPYFGKDDGIKIFSSNRSRPKRSPNGIYDRILCDTCEKSFSEADGKIHGILERYCSNNIMRVMNDEDQVILGKFVSSLLLRMHFSKQEAFRDFDLGGKHIESIRAYLLDSSNYPDSVLYFFAKYPEHVGVHSPSRTPRTDGFYFWIVDMGIYGLYLKIDSRPLPEAHDFSCLFERDHPYVFCDESVPDRVLIAARKASKLLSFK